MHVSYVLYYTVATITMQYGSNVTYDCLLSDEHKLVWYTLIRLIAKFKFQCLQTQYKHVNFTSEA